MEKEEFLVREIEKLGISVEKSQAEKLLAYYRMLVAKNEVMNLTAITDFEEVVIKHFADSLSIVKLNGMKELLTSGGPSLIDVGTGAGFPGMVLKIVFPGVRVTLLDSLQKRIEFLTEVSDALGLQDIRCVHGRCEDLAKPGPDSLRESFDLCTSRAVARLSVLSEYALPFVRVGGSFVAYKSGDYQEELAQAGNAITTLGGGEAQVESFLLPGTEISRTLIRMEKTAPTPEKYPRKAGMPAKKPL